MRRTATWPVVLLLLAAACTGPPRTPEQEAKLTYLQLLSGYTEAAKAAQQWAATGNLSLKDAEQFEALREPAKKALDSMKAAIDRGEYGTVDVLKATVHDLLLWYIARKEA